MTWFRCQNGNGGGGGEVYADIHPVLTGGIISNTSGFQTATFPDVSAYTYIYINIYEPYDIYQPNTDRKYDYDRCSAQIVKVSDLGNNTLSLRTKHLWGSATVYYNLTKTSITCTDSYNKYHYIYADIIATNDPIELGGGGPTIFPIIKNELISDTTGYKTVNFPDISAYTYIYVFVTEGNTTLVATQNANRSVCLTVADIGNPSTFALGYYWDSGNISISITKTSVTCNSYSNPYRNIYCTIIATNTLIQ